MSEIREWMFTTYQKNAELDTNAKAINALINIMTLKLNRIYNKLVEDDEVITANKI